MSEDVLFSEPSAAAQSLKNFWTRMASTYRCIGVYLTQKQLTVKPRWFIGWLIRLLALDLYHVVPTQEIKAVERRGKWFGYGRLQITYREAGADRSILLYLKKHDEFVDKARQFIERQAP